MASFLNNNGDILLDAVLTDYGRKLLAKGDGSFNITKFAFADDEIDYGLYKTEGETVSRDSEIMVTPILEAITNNASSVKSPLLTLGMENVLFMPVMKLFAQSDNNTGSFGGFNGYVVPVNISNNTSGITKNYLSSSNNKIPDPGVLNHATRMIMVDHGLDSDKLSNTESLETVYPMMYETQFNVYVDSRFASVGMIYKDILTPLDPLSVDDDGVSIFKLTTETNLNNQSFVSKIDTLAQVPTSIKGTRGSRISFTLVPNINLTSTNTMFDRYGKVSRLITGSSQEFRTIRSYVTIEGINTGCSIEIPILFAKVKLD